MPYLYIHPSFPLLSGGPTGPARLTYPFWSEGDTTTITIEQDWVQSWTTYRPPALSSPINFADLKVSGFALPANASACIFLEDTQPQDIGQGCCKVTRTWGTVPITRNIPASFSVALPGFTGINLNGYVRVLSAQTLTLPTGFTTTIAAENVNTGPAIDSFLYGVFLVAFRKLAFGNAGAPNALYSYTFYHDHRSNLRTSRVAVASPLSVTADNGYMPTIADFPQLAGWQIIDIRFRGWVNSPYQSIFSRLARNRLVTGYHYFQYAVGRAAAVLLAKDKMEPVDNSGLVVETLTGTTSPSLSTWLREITNRNSFPSEDSQISRYRGDVWEVVTPYAPYK